MGDWVPAKGSVLRTSEVRAPPWGLLCTLISVVAKKVPGRNRDPGPLPMIRNANSCVVERAGVWPEDLRKDNMDTERTANLVERSDEGRSQGRGTDGEAGAKGPCEQGLRAGGLHWYSRTGETGS